MPQAQNGQAMKVAYENRGLTREQFARRVGLSPQTITNIANGGLCSRPAAVRIANELGWASPKVLFGSEAETRETAEATEAGEATAEETEAEARAAS